MSHSTSVDSVPVKSISALKEMARELKEQGINVELVQNAVPRLYYRDQIAKHFKAKDKDGEFSYNDNPEQCDWVLQVKDAFYDIGFLRKKDGSYTPIFDDYDYTSSQVPSTSNGYGPIRDYLGRAFAGEVKHWSGRQTDNDQSLHSIGKMLTSYTKHAAIEQAEAEGMMMTSCEDNADGSLRMEFEVM